MTKYLIEENVSSQAMAGILQKPEDRNEVLKPLFEAVGCKLEQFYVALTENKAYLIVDSPNPNSLCTLMANFLAGGAASSIKATPIITMSEGVGLFKKAAGLGYRPPGR